MYVHIGNGISMNEKNIIAIFNFQEMKNTPFYQNILIENNVEKISKGKERSLILIQKNKKIKAYISNIHSNTLGKRKL